MSDFTPCITITNYQLGNFVRKHVTLSLLFGYPIPLLFNDYCYLITPAIIQATVELSDGDITCYTALRNHSAWNIHVQVIFYAKQQENIGHKNKKYTVQKEMFAFGIW